MKKEYVRRQIKLFEPFEKRLSGFITELNRSRLGWENLGWKNISIEYLHCWEEIEIMGDRLETDAELKRREYNEKRKLKRRIAKYESNRKDTR